MQLDRSDGHPQCRDAGESKVADCFRYADVPVLIQIGECISDKTAS